MKYVTVSNLENHWVYPMPSDDLAHQSAIKQSVFF